MNDILYTLFQDNTELPGKICEFCKKDAEFCQAEREFEAISKQVAEKLGRELYFDFEFTWDVGQTDGTEKKEDIYLGDFAGTLTSIISSGWACVKR